MFKLYYIENSNSVDLDEVAYFEPPHQDLRCLQIQLFLSLVLKELTAQQALVLPKASSLVRNVMQ